MNSSTKASDFQASILRTIVKCGTVSFILVGLFLYNLYFVGRKTIRPLQKSIIYTQKFGVATEQSNDSFVPLVYLFLFHVFCHHRVVKKNSK
jgi:hypothetical protein